MRIGVAFLALGALALSLFAAPLPGIQAGTPGRHSRTLVAVDPQARTLVLEEIVGHSDFPQGIEVRSGTGRPLTW